MDARDDPPVAADPPPDHAEPDGSGVPGFAGADGDEPAPEAAPPAALPGRRGLLLEVGFVALVLVHLAAFAVVFGVQHQGDGLAQHTIETAERLEIDRIMWPTELRGSVPKLLAAGITPVLNDVPDVPAQQLVVNRTRLLVTAKGAHLDDVTTHREEDGDYNLRVIDLDRAKDVPLPAGQRVAREYSRPYIFAPLRDSLAITVDKPLEITVRLPPGPYAFSLDVMDKPQAGAIKLTIDGAEIVRAGPKKLAVIVYEPMVTTFAVRGDEPATVKITVAATTPEVKAGKKQPKKPKKADIRVHRWSIDGGGE